MLEEKLNNSFKLPIDFCKETKETPDNLYDDLELLQSKDASGNSVYNHLFNPKSPFGAILLQKWAKKYTCFIVIDITGGMGVATSRKPLFPEAEVAEMFRNAF